MSAPILDIEKMAWYALGIRRNGRRWCHCRGTQDCTGAMDESGSAIMDPDSRMQPTYHSFGRFEMSGFTQISDWRW